MRVGFLFNHYAVHQVPHAAPYAFELSRRHPDFDVVIACSTKQEMQLVHEIAVLYPGHRCTFRPLRPAWYYRLIDPIASKWSLKRKKMVLSNNLEFFAPSTHWSRRNVTA
jgi:hypothetical protein